MINYMFAFVFQTPVCQLLKNLCLIKQGWKTVTALKRAEKTQLIKQKIQGQKGLLNN